MHNPNYDLEEQNYSPGRGDISLGKFRPEELDLLVPVLMERFCHLFLFHCGGILFARGHKSSKYGALHFVDGWRLGARKKR
jgi:hypothetical protein